MRFPTLGAAVAAAALWATPVYAQHEPGQAAGKHETPDTYVAAVAEIDERLQNIDGLIKSGKLDGVHAEAQVIVGVANTLAQLALKPGSGVPKEAVKEINKTAKELAGKFDAIDEAGDSGDEAATRKVYAEMVALQATLRKHAPAEESARDLYSCPMHPEVRQVGPGTCPKCGMALVKHTTDKYSVDVQPSGGAITAGKSATLKLALKDPTGALVTKLETVHERILHLLVVSRDLSWYAHEHPVVQPDGTFTLTVTFPQGGDYVLYHDFSPPGVGQQVVQAPLKVDGSAPAPVALEVDAAAPKAIDGYMIALDTGGEVKTGGETHMAYTITRDGKPVTDLQPYLGAMGHLVIISQDLESFVHSHPHEEGAEHAGGGEGGPRVDFEAHFQRPGLYKGWAQFQHSGKVITAPFTFEVMRGDAGPEPHDHGG
ncbi:MAG: hypothetical protein HY812_09405 [Planctomycetes bacterium]|nr:hypothetical protein [Planctomycetota bacterium]